MLQRIESPANVLAFRAIGKIEKDDYDAVLEPAVDAMTADRDEVRFVYVLGDDYDGFSVAATWEDAKLGIGHASKWKKVAFVTDHGALRHAVGMFAWMVPGEMRTFGLDEESTAIDWAAE